MGVQLFIVIDSREPWESTTRIMHIFHGRLFPLCLQGWAGFLKAGTMKIIQEKPWSETTNCWNQIKTTCYLDHYCDYTKYFFLILLTKNKAFIIYNIY